MSEAPILVVGGGPAGVSVATALAEQGIPVLLIEQRDRLGGAIHRQAANAQLAHTIHAAHHIRRWKALTARLETMGDLVRKRFKTVFVGVDDCGAVLLEDRSEGKAIVVRPRALILAVGAIEQIHPFEGWHLPGVFSAGGAQLMLKETGRFAPGRTLVAGSGPLPFAFAAQLAAIGTIPVALVQKSAPWRSPNAALQLLASPQVAKEAMHYGVRLLMARIPIIAGATVESALPHTSGMLVNVRTTDGNLREYAVDNLVISDGLQPNQTGLPASRDNKPYPIIRVGDCREILGADAAIEDGAFAARKITAILRQKGDLPRPPRAIARARRTQALLGKLTMAPPTAPFGNPILCRCEGMRLSDLAALGPDRSAFETRLVGRFGLGPCQGRFCRTNVAQLSGLSAEELERRDAGKPRWPLRPISIAALCALRSLEDSDNTGEET